MLKSEKNYYEILGVTPDVDLVELKSVYRRLVRKFHPDINPEGENRFKDITKAYETLSDENRRKQYDIINGIFKSTASASKDNTTYRKSFSEAKAKQEEKNSEFDKKQTSSAKKQEEKIFLSFINDMIDGLSRASTSKNASRKKSDVRNGEDIVTDVKLTFKESVCGVQKIVNIAQTNVCEHCKGRKFINGAKCPHCSGTGKIVSYQKIKVTIPANVKNGAKLRLAGEGKKGVNGGKNGDLFLKIIVEQDSCFVQDGKDLKCEVPISPFEAVLGGDIVIPSILGDLVLTLPEYTKSGQIFRISASSLKKNNFVGDIIVTVRIQIPDTLSDDELNLYRKLRDLADVNLRKMLYND